jgi:hypothetical protein
VRLPDANVLIYAVSSGLPHHDISRNWLDRAVDGDEPIGFAWLVLIAFLRITTSRVIFPQPVSADEALDAIEGWLDRDAAIVLEPGPDHLRRVRELLHVTGSGGNLVNDSHLAALALAHRATVITFDNDFGRFAGVRWQRPDDID